MSSMKLNLSKCKETTTICQEEFGRRSSLRQDHLAMRCAIRSLDSTLIRTALVIIGGIAMETVLRRTRLAKVNQYRKSGSSTMRCNPKKCPPLISLHLTIGRNLRVNRGHASMSLKQNTSSSRGAHRMLFKPLK